MKQVRDVSPRSVLESFKRVVKKWQKLEKETRKFGTAIELYSSEIHLIETIGENEGSSVTDIARLLDITKGAVSQTLKKLKIKKLAKKEEDPANASRILVELTPLGWEAFNSHKRWHEAIDGGFRKYFLELESEQIIFLKEFLKMFEAFLDNKGKLKE